MSDAPAQMRHILSNLGYTYDESFMSELIPLLACAQAHRLEKGDAKASEVTRSTALVFLNQLNPAIGQGLTSAGVDWSSYCRELELEGPVTPKAVADVKLHSDFIEALARFRRSYRDKTAATTENLALAIVAMAATSETGLVGDRLKKAGGNPSQLVDKLLQPIKIAESEPSGKKPDGSDKPGRTQGMRPTVWLLQYKEEDRTAALFGKVDENAGIAWRSTKLIKSIKPGDPVLYWRAINRRTNDRGDCLEPAGMDQIDPQLNERQDELDEIIRTNDPAHRDVQAENLRKSVPNCSFPMSGRRPSGIRPKGSGS